MVWELYDALVNVRCQKSDRFACTGVACIVPEERQNLRLLETVHGPSPCMRPAPSMGNP